jgi:hypothetical protein
MIVDRDGKVVNKVSGYEFRHRTREDLEIGSPYLVVHLTRTSRGSVQRFFSDHQTCAASRRRYDAYHNR